MQVTSEDSAAFKISVHSKSTFQYRFYVIKSYIIKFLFEIALAKESQTETGNFLLMITLSA